MSNQDIADALFVDEDDMAQLATQNELFKLIGVTDGDPRYSDVLLIADWHTRKLNEARIDEIRRTRPHLTYPGMVYYGERMNELRGAETEEVK
jgi:hypothetical protein